MLAKGKIKQLSNNITILLNPIPHLGNKAVKHNILAQFCSPFTANAYMEILCNNYSFIQSNTDLVPEKFEIEYCFSMSVPLNASVHTYRTTIKFRYTCSYIIYRRDAFYMND